LEKGIKEGALQLARVQIVFGRLEAADEGLRELEGVVSGVKSFVGPVVNQ